MSRGTGARRRDERGVVLILVAVIMVALLTMTAIVIDLGHARASRRADQTAADLASIAAGFFLSGRGSVPVVSNPREACMAAITSVETNVTEFTPHLSEAAKAAACAGFPVDARAGCDPAPAPVSIARGPYTLEIRYPVTDAEIADSRFAGGTGLNDGTDPCARMRVTLVHANPTTFAKIVGLDTVTTTGTAVVRAKTDRTGLRVAALLLLERVGCGVLHTSGGGSSGSGAVVQASSATNPGVIQADSAGIVGAPAPTSCTTSNTTSGFVVYGTALPAAGGGGPSIVAGDAANGTPGIIGIYAGSVGGRTGAVYPGGISVGPIGSIITSRQPADDKYNTPAVNGGHAQITTLHATGYSRATMSLLEAVAAGYTVITALSCNIANTGNPLPTATKIFVDCPTFSPGQLIFPEATDVVFAGKLDIGNGSVLSLPKARRIFVRGCTTSCSGGGDIAVSVAGTLLVNTGDTAIPSPVNAGTTCASRQGPGGSPPGTNTRWTQLATFGGPLVVSGLVRLCQTFVYLGANAPSYVRQAVTVPGGAYPTVAQCSALLPCPKDDSTNHANISFGGGGGQADWNAPNQLATQPTDTDFVTHPFEDIALWSEASGPSSLRGQGANRTEGVYFLPNADLTFTGQASQNLPLNAQLFARSLNVSGQGTLNLRPNPVDTILTAIPGNIELIR